MTNTYIRNNRSLSTTRRRFLDSVAYSGLSSRMIKSSPLLAGLLANRYAYSQNKVRRVVFVYTPLGAPQNRWLPSPTGLNKATEGFAGTEKDCHFHDTYVVNAGFGIMRAALGEVRWGNDWTCDTIDHQIANVLGVTSPFPSLQLGVQSHAQGEWSRLSTRGVLGVPLLDGPAKAYSAIFSTNTAQSLNQKQSTITALQDAMQCDKNLLSHDERITMERYEHSLAQLQGKLSPIVDDVQACSPKPLDLSHTPGAMSFIDEAKLQAEVLTQALECGMTNVGVLQLSNETGDFIGSDPTFTGGMHVATCGSPPGSDHYANLLNDLSGCIAHLIKLLSERDDPAVPGTKLIDNTLVLQVSSLGDGPNHGPNGAPCVIGTRIPEFKTGVITPQSSLRSTNLKILQTVAVGLGLEEYIGKQNHHCIWPCAGEHDADFYGHFLT